MYVCATKVGAAWVGCAPSGATSNESAAIAGSRRRRCRTDGFIWSSPSGSGRHGDWLRSSLELPASMTTSIFGSAVLRSEDLRFLRGAGRYVENLPIEGALRAVFVRSMMAHAELGALDVSGVASMPGVAGVFTAED